MCSRALNSPLLPWEHRCRCGLAVRGHTGAHGLGYRIFAAHGDVDSMPSSKNWPKQVNPGTIFAPNINTLQYRALPLWPPRLTKGCWSFPGRRGAGWDPQLCPAAPPRLPHVSAAPEHAQSCVSEQYPAPAVALAGEQSGGSSRGVLISAVAKPSGRQRQHRAARSSSCRETFPQPSALAINCGR